ncbi:F-box protein At5g62510-like [Actinidia eriantha]|uniref:F-box protein At5g62510-like n=1 Tax=Actinidia eriantha TaxID=165200 RepID=UPI0025865D1F|nr:F-box protein At5g62510-like [Actinidia eriantha]
MAIVQELPEDLLTEILSRFPVKFLFRFRSASKQWLSLIQNLTFVSLQNNECLLVKRSLRRDNGDCVLSLVPNEAPIHDLDISSTTLQDVREIQHLGSCNGLIFLQNCVTGSFVVCNPGTKEITTLPNPFITRGVGAI